MDSQPRADDGKESPDAVQSKLPVKVRWLALMAAYHLLAMVVLHYHKYIGAAVVVAGLGIFARPLSRILGLYLVGSWRILNREASELRAADPQDAFDYRPLVVLATSAVILTLIEYYGDRGTYQKLVSAFYPGVTRHHYYTLTQFYYWSLFRIVSYVVVPWLVVLAMPGERIRDYGMSVQGFWRHLWIYIALFGIILPVLVMVSYTAPFQKTYPFYKLAARSWGDFLAWELAYALQFFALEVFFRGFMLHPLKKAMGAHSVFVMAVPYCMIHYNKPLAEVLGAIVAGTVLGTLSLRTRSIWCGVLVHVSVAVVMDLLAIWQTAGYPGNPQFVG